MRALLIALNILLLLAIFGVALFWHPAADEAPLPGLPRVVADVPLADLPMGGDFTLDGPRGAVSLSDYRGRLVLLQFGYTYCPDICPTALTIIADALAGLTAAERARVQALFVSVDPERDTVARLAEYTAFFHPDIVGLTGPNPRLAEIASRYGAVFVRQDDASAGGYVIDHTALTYLIDGEGRLVASLPHATPAPQLLAEMRKHLPTH
ncbi:MAG: SCO family protein [Pseudomonadota bacterium]